MTEYDYSPDAWERYMATQHRIARWVDGTLQQVPCNAFSPATPHVQALALQERQGRFSDESDDDDGASQRRSSHRKQRSHRSRREDPDREYVFVEIRSPTSTTRPRAASHAPKPRSRRVHPNLTLDLTPFPSQPVHDPYSYRHSGHSSHSSNTTTPTSITPTKSNGMFQSQQFPTPPYSAPPLLGSAPKPMRSQTMPIPPHYLHPSYYPQQQPIMVPLRPDMKGYTSYGPDPSKSPQIPWSDYMPPSPTKPPSLLKRMFTGLTSKQHSQAQPQSQPQYPYPGQQYPEPPKTRPSREQHMFLGGGSNRISRKRSESF